MFALMVFYWNYFWYAFSVAFTTYVTSLSTWIDNATWFIMNCYGAYLIHRALRGIAGNDDPNLIYSPTLDDYVSFNRFRDVEDAGEWKHAYEQIPPEERTWFQRAMIWLGLDISK
ncbi:MAG: hypothetical protein RL243_1268 [Actinomycetota bacterium]